MGWHYTPPENFPLRWREAHEAASLVPIVLTECRTARQAKAIAEEFRRFRWCLRNTPTARAAISREESLTYRLAISPRHGLFALSLTAKPSLSQSLLALNLSLAEDTT